MTEKTETQLTDAWIDEESVDIYEGPTDKPVPYLNAERCRQLERTLRESQKDAERYRWVRDKWWLDDKADETPDPMIQAETAEQFDAAIDAALPQPESQDEGGKGQ